MTSSHWIAAICLIILIPAFVGASSMAINANANKWEQTALDRCEDDAFRLSHTKECKALEQSENERLHRCVTAGHFTGKTPECVSLRNRIYAKADMAERGGG